MLDFLSAGEATVVSWELLSLYHQYGLGLWGAGAWATITAKLYRYKAEASPCPYTHLLSALARTISPRQAVIRVAAQLAGGTVFYRCYSLLAVMFADSLTVVLNGIKSQVVLLLDTQVAV